PITVVMDREDARIVEESLLGQDLEAPECVPYDGECRRTVAEHRGADRIFDHALRSPRVRLEGRAVHSVDEAVPIAMACNLVTSRVNLADERRIPLGEPAEHEEGGRGPLLIEGV